MVLGDLGSCSVNALFQRELSEEMDVLKTALKQFKARDEAQEALSFILMSLSAIYGLSKLVDLEEIESLCSLMVSGVKDAKTKHSGEISSLNLDFLSQGVALLDDFCQVQDLDLETWKSQEHQTIQACIESLSDRLGISKSSHLASVETKQNDSEPPALWEPFITGLFQDCKKLQRILFEAEQSFKQSQRFETDEMIAQLKEIHTQAKHFSTIQDLITLCLDALKSSKYALETLFHSLDLLFFISSLTEDDFQQWLQDYGSLENYVIESIKEEKGEFASLVDKPKELCNQKTSTKLDLQSSKVFKRPKLLQLAALNLVQLSEAKMPTDHAHALFEEVLQRSVYFLDSFLHVLTQRYPSLEHQILRGMEHLAVDRACFESLTTSLEALLQAAFRSQIHAQPLSLQISLSGSVLCIHLQAPREAMEQIQALNKNRPINLYFEEFYFSKKDVSTGQRYLQSAENTNNNSQNLYLICLEDLYHNCHKRGFEMQILRDGSLVCRFEPALFSLKGSMFKGDDTCLFSPLSSAVEMRGDHLHWQGQRYPFKEQMGTTQIFFDQMQACSNGTYQLPSLLELALRLMPMNSRVGQGDAVKDLKVSDTYLLLLKE